MSRCKHANLSFLNTANEKHTQKGMKHSLLTCRAVVLHLADKYAESMLRAPTDTETQTTIWTLVYCHSVNVLTVFPSCNHTEP